MGYRSDILNNFSFKIIKIISGIIISIIIARQFGVTGNGYISFFILILDMLSTNSHMGINDAIVYFYKKKNYTNKELFQNGLSFILIISIVLAVIILSLKFFQLYFFEYSLHIIISGIIYLLCKSISIHLNSFYIADEKIVLLNKYTFFSDALKLCLIFGLYISNFLSFDIYFTVITISQVILSSMQMINIKIPYKFGCSFNLLYTEFKYGFFIFLGSLCILLNYKVDQFFIKIYFGDYELGLYSLAVMSAELLFIIPQSVKTVLSGRLLNIKIVKGNTTTYLTLKLTFYISCIMIIIVCVLSPIIPLIYGKDFKLSILPTIILLIGTLFASLATVLTSYVLSLGKNKTQFLFSFNTVLVNIILNILLIPPYGINGAAIASLISYAVYGGQYLYFFIKIEQCAWSKVFIITRSDLDRLNFSFIKKWL